MPYRKRYKKKPMSIARRNRYNKRKKYKWLPHNRASRLLLYSPSLMPDTMYVKLKYVENTTRTAASFSNVFRLNGIYDPNLTGTGHQPMGHDQWNNFYNEYQVYGSAINVRAINSLTGNDSEVVLYPSSNSTALGVGDAKEQPYSKCRLLGNSHSGKNIISLKKYMSVSKYIGRDTKPLAYSSPFGSDPTETIFWVITGRSLDSVSANNITLQVTIIYYVKLFNKKSLVGS